MDEWTHPTASATATQLDPAPAKSGASRTVVVCRTEKLEVA